MSQGAGGDEGGALSGQTLCASGAHTFPHGYQGKARDCPLCLHPLGCTFPSGGLPGTLAPTQGCRNICCTPMSFRGPGILTY